VCDLETSGIGAPYIYDISHLRVKSPGVFTYFINLSVREVSIPWRKNVLSFFPRDGHSGDRIPVGSEFSGPVQTGPRPSGYHFITSGPSEALTNRNTQRWGKKEKSFRGLLYGKLYLYLYLCSVNINLDLIIVQVKGSGDSAPVSINLCARLDLVVSVTHR
jgi:hypothetical protein